MDGMQHDCLPDDDKLFECVAFVVRDPFNGAEPVTRERRYVWAQDEREAMDVFEEHHVSRLFDDGAPWAGAALLNWFAQEVEDPDALPDGALVMGVLTLKELENAGQLRLGFTTVH
jgi:hypothetical protein